MAIVHRRVQLLVGHLDRSGLFGGGSTVAWGGSGDLVRLHLVVCGLEVGRHIVGVGQVSRKGQGSAGENASTGRAQQATKQAGPGRDRSTRASTTHGRGVAGQAGRTAARAHRCEYVRRDEAARGVRQAQAQASRRAGRRVARGFLRPSKTHRKRWPVT